MIFEDFDTEYFMDKMLSSIPNGDDIDKREGSIIYDALKPVALELGQVFIQLDWFFKNILADTAERPFLIRRALERGLEPYNATYATVKGEFNIPIEINKRFTFEELEYVISRELNIEDGKYYYELQCETPGTIGNVYSGELTPTGYIANLKHSKIVDVIHPGEDEEDTEDFRQRYYKSINNMAYGGNIADYIEKVEEAPGVGRCKIYPIWNGGGTVKVVFQDSEYMPPNDELVNEIQKLLYPLASKEGEGLGLAPIGHTVTVEGVKPVEINIIAKLELEEGISFDVIKPLIEEKVEAYLETELREKWADKKYLVVRQAIIEGDIIDIEGVADVDEVIINSNPKNVTLADDEIPILGSVING